MGEKLPSAACKDCVNKDTCTLSCVALERLLRMMKVIDREEKARLLQEYKKDLELIFAEPDPETEVIALRIIDKYPEFDFIRDMDIKIGFIRSYEQKMKDGKATLGACEKVSEKYKAYLPYDYIITIYKSNTYYLSDNQYKLLIYHELKHITVGMRGLTIRPHDIEDFKDILKDFGLNWSSFNNNEIPDILA